MAAEITGPDINGFLSLEKLEIYCTTATTRERMKIKIRVAFQQIMPFHLSRVCRNFMKKFRKCIEQGGRYFEHVL